MARKKMTWLLNVLNTKRGGDVISDAIFDNVSCTWTRHAAARGCTGRVSHTHSLANTKAAICLVFHPSLSTFHIPLHCCLSVGQLSDYCVGAECE